MLAQRLCFSTELKTKVFDLEAFYSSGGYSGTHKPWRMSLTGPWWKMTNTIERVGREMREQLEMSYHLLIGW